MQLKNPKRISEGLALAACSLLLPATDEARAAGTEDDWDFDVSALNYQENNGRIRVVEWDMVSKWQYSADSLLSISFISDSITGATPSGATRVAGPASQTSTTASGTVVASDVGEAAGNYLAPLVEVVDQRFAIGAGLQQTWSRLYTTNLGLQASSEEDYESVGASASLGRDFSKKTTRIEAGVAWSWDTISPNFENGPPPEGELVGGRPYSYEAGHKQTLDMSLSLTRILTRHTLMRFSYIRGNTNGYLSDPYKVVTTRSDISWLPLRYYYERRPNARIRQALNMELTSQTAPSRVFNAWYRYYSDDWDIESHTVDLKLRWDYAPARYLGVHTRWYRQSAAYFYYPWLTETQDANLPTYLSADYRLDNMQSYTAGLKWGMDLGNFGEFRIRLERILQYGSVGDYRSMTANVIHAAVNIAIKD